MKPIALAARLPSGPESFSIPVMIQCDTCAGKQCVFKRSDKITCRYSVDPNFTFSSCFKSKHLNKTVDESYELGLTFDSVEDLNMGKLTLVSLSSAAFAELMPPPYLCYIQYMYTT